MSRRARPRWIWPSSCATIPRLQKDKRSQSSDHDVVWLDRVLHRADDAHQSVKHSKRHSAKDEMIAPSMVYAYASLMEGVPFANGAPNLTVDLPVMLELSATTKLPSAVRTSRPSDPDEDRAGAGVQGATPRSERGIRPIFSAIAMAKC